MTKKVSFTSVLYNIFIAIFSVFGSSILALLVATLFEASDKTQDIICLVMMYSIISLLNLVLIYQVYLVALGKKAEDRFIRLTCLFLVSPFVTILFVLALEVLKINMLLELLEKYNFGIVATVIYASVLATGLLIRVFREIFFALRRLRLA